MMLTSFRGGAVALGLTALVACAGDGTAERVHDALIASGIEEVDVRADGERIRLSGTVDTLADRTRAVELATAVAGTSVVVTNAISVSGIGPLDGSPTEPSPAAGTGR